MNRPSGRSAAIALLVLQSAAANAAAPAGEPVTRGVRGETVTPRRVHMASLPALGSVFQGPPGERSEPVTPGVDEDRERQKRQPHAILPGQGGQFTLASGSGVAAPLPGTGFEGILQNGWIPGEPTVAAGPQNIFSTGNVSVTVTNKDGSQRVETTGRAFFGIPPGEGDISDPQCFYDAVRGRFLALAFTESASPVQYSYFYLAISQTSDARGDWWIYKFDQTRDGSVPTGNWSDYESLGLSDDKIGMSSQQYSFGSNVYQYQKIRVVDRAMAYAGVPVTYVDFAHFAAPPGGDSQDLFVTKVARNLSAGDATLHGITVRTNGGARIAYREITGPPSAPVLSAGDLVPCAAYAIPPDAVQKGTGYLVTTNDCRPTDSYVRNGVLVATWHSALTLGGSVTGIHVFRMRCSDRVVLQDEVLGASGTFLYYPAVTVDSVGTLFLGFDRSSSTEYPSCWASGRRRSDPALESAVLLKGGLTAMFQSRWGDYTGIDLDAAASGPGGAVAWYAGQWAKGGGTFGTWINRLSFGYGQIAGTVLDDCDGDTTTTADQSGLPGVGLSLRQDGATFAALTTDASGNFDFGYLEGGTFDLVVAPPAGGAALDAVAGAGGTSQTRMSPTDIRVSVTHDQTSAGNVFVVTSPHALPVAAGLAPATRTAGDSAFTLSVTGSGFVRCASVWLDGSPRATTWVGAGQLDATIPASDLTTPGQHVITVFNPAPAGGESNPETLLVLAPDVVPPTVTVLVPNGGELWGTGTTHAITWNASDDVGVTAIDLVLSHDGGATFPDVIATGLANTGSTPWIVPDTPGADERIRAIAHDAAGHTAADTSDASFTIATGATDAGQPGAPAISLVRITPDPVRGVARFRVGLPQRSALRLTVHDLQGRRLAVLASGAWDAGWHEVRWDAPEAPPGLYFVRLSVPGRTFVQRLVRAR
jgi:SdrD B-like protein